MPRSHTLDTKPPTPLDSQRKEIEYLSTATSENILQNYRYNWLFFHSDWHQVKMAVRSNETLSSLLTSVPQTALGARRPPARPRSRRRSRVNGAGGRPYLFIRKRGCWLSVSFSLAWRGRRGLLGGVAVVIVVIRTVWGEICEELYHRVEVICGGPLALLVRALSKVVVVTIVVSSGSWGNRS